MAGGGTDVVPYCFENEGAVVNVTINKYCHVSLKEAVETTFHSVDLQKEEAYLDGKLSSLPLHFGVHKFFEEKLRQRPKLRVETDSEAPAGSGLGSSSTIVVALVAAYAKYFNINFSNFDLAEISVDIERHNLELAGGLQDQYAASFGGLNFLQFTKNRETIINRISCSQAFVRFLENNMFLINSGKSRDSSKIITKQITMAEDKDIRFEQSLKKMRDLAFSLKSSILRENYEDFINVMRQSWIAKKYSSNDIVNDVISQIEQDVSKVGGLSFKVSGAGGGGFCQVYTKPGEKRVTMNKLLRLGYDVEDVTFINEGVIAWDIS